MPFKTAAEDPKPKKKVFVIQPQTPYDFLKDKMPNYTALEGPRDMIAYTVTEFDYSEGESVFGETRQFTIPGIWENYHCSVNVGGTIYHAHPGGILKLGGCGFENVPFFSADGDEFTGQGIHSFPACGAFWTGEADNKQWKLMVLSSEITVFDLNSRIFYETLPSNANHYEGKLATLPPGRGIVAIGGAMYGEEKFES